MEVWDFGKEDTPIMLQLKKLRIDSCEKLKSMSAQLCRSTTLEELGISYCPIIRENCRKMYSLPNIIIHFFT